MNKFWMIFLLASLSLASCISVSPATGTSTPPPRFVTSTLPPTRVLVLPSTATPSTPEADVDVTGTVTVVPTSPPDCKVQAVLLEDVTIPDNTRLEAGETFTKTWRFKNTGTCHWKDYTIDFLTGDRMGASESAPIPDTLAGSEVDVSLELIAPTTDGTYTGYFTLMDAEGESIDIGTEKSFWLKIVVGDPVTETPATSSGGAFSNTTGSATGGGTANCNYSENAGYVSQIGGLINSERRANGMPELTVSALLASAAQKHAADMACNNMLSHTGSDGSYVNARVAATGYGASYSEEIIYAGGSPQTAFNWWMSDKLHRNAILNTKATEMGIGYAYLDSSAYGGYIAVNFANP